MRCVFIAGLVTYTMPFDMQAIIYLKAERMIASYKINTSRWSSHEIKSKGRLEKNVCILSNFRMVIISVAVFLNSDTWPLIIDLSRDLEES